MKKKIFVYNKVYRKAKKAKKYLMQINIKTNYYYKLLYIKYVINKNKKQKCRSRLN